MGRAFSVPRRPFRARRRDRLPPHLQTSPRGRLLEIAFHRPAILGVALGAPWPDEGGDPAWGAHRVAQAGALRAEAGVEVDVLGAPPLLDDITLLAAPSLHLPAFEGRVLDDKGVAFGIDEAFREEEASALLGPPAGVQEDGTERWWLYAVEGGVAWLSWDLDARGVAERFTALRFEHDDDPDRAVRRR